MAVASDAVGAVTEVLVGVGLGVSVGAVVSVTGALVGSGAVTPLPPTEADRTIRGATHSARSPRALPLASTVRMKLTF